MRDAFHEGLFLPREQKRKRSKKMLSNLTNSTPTDLVSHIGSCDSKPEQRDVEKGCGSQESSVL